MYTNKTLTNIGDNAIKLNRKNFSSKFNNPIRDFDINMGILISIPRIKKISEILESPSKLILIIGKNNITTRHININEIISNKSAVDNTIFFSIFCERK